MIKIQFSCGHTGMIADTAITAPVCAECGESQIAHVLPTRMPTFTGACTGPYAEYQRVEPAVVNVATAGPLLLKKES